MGSALFGRQAGRRSLTQAAVRVPPQIMSLAHCPNEDWVVLGLASGEQWLHPTNSGKTRLLGSQENPILGLKFSPFGKQLGWGACIHCTQSSFLPGPAPSISLCHPQPASYPVSPARPVVGECGHRWPGQHLLHAPGSQGGPGRVQGVAWMGAGLMPGRHRPHPSAHPVSHPGTRKLVRHVL